MNFAHFSLGSSLFFKLHSISPSAYTLFTWPPVGGNWSCFLCFAVNDSAAVNDGMDTLLMCRSVCVLNFRSGFAWSKDLWASNVKRYCQISCPSNESPHLTPPPAVYMSASFLPASEQTGLLPFGFLSQ